MESILRLEIPIQMIFCTDTDGKITPIRFRFKDKDGAIIVVNISQILSSDQERNSMAAQFVCGAEFYGRQQTFRLRYSYYAHEWKMIGVHSC